MDDSRDIELGRCTTSLLGSTAGRTFGIRDFNAQVMMNAYTAQERDGLLPALESLVETGILARVSATDFRLTAKGTRLLHAKKRDLGSGYDVAGEDSTWT